MGPTHVQRARTEASDSIRGRFSFSDTRNVVHGSGKDNQVKREKRSFLFEQNDQSSFTSKDSEETARREIEFFFPNFDFEKALKDVV